MKTTILLTGHNGFLGKELLRNLNTNNIIIKTCSRSNHSDFSIDLSNKIPNFNYKFDVVIHSAGKAHSIPKYKNEVDSFYYVNVQGTRNLLNGLSSNIPKQFVFISSVSVYGLINGENIKEICPLIANDPYGKSKIEAEGIVKMWCDKNNVVCTILRLPLVIGINPPGNFGAMIRGIKKGYYFNIGGGRAKKSLVLASDIAKYILKAAEVGGIYNLTDGIHPSFYELSKGISHHLDKSFVPNMPLFIAKILAIIGDIIGNISPINSYKFSKITSTLTFDDTNARIAFGWNPNPVLESFKLHEDA